MLVRKRGASERPKLSLEMESLVQVSVRKMSASHVVLIDRVIHSSAFMVLEWQIPGLASLTCYKVVCNL